MDERVVEYHLRYRPRDLMRERHNERLAQIAIQASKNTQAAEPRSERELFIMRRAVQAALAWFQSLAKLRPIAQRPRYDKRGL